MINEENWTSTLKSIAHDVVGSIPEIGKLAQVALDLFWPDKDKPNVWEQIKAQTESLIDKKILDQELNNIQSSLDEIYTDFKNYALYSKPPVQGQLQRYLGNILHDSEQIFTRIKEDPQNQRVHLLPILVALASLELTALCEQYSHGQTIWGKASPAYETQLKNRYDEYQQLFSQLYNEWKTWRAQQITAEYSYTIGDDKYGDLQYWYYAIVTDQVNKASHKLFYYGGLLDDGSPIAKPYAPLVEPVKGITQMLLGNAIAEMAGVLSGAVYLHNFLPNISNYDEPVFIADLATLTLGPFSQCWANIENYTAINATDELGTVDTVRVYSDSNGINGMQTLFSDRIGRLAGQEVGSYSPVAGMQLVDPEGAAEYGRYITGFNTRFLNNAISSIQAIYGDGFKGEQLGSSHGYPLTGSVPNSYKIAAVDYGLSNNRISTISFKFNFVPKFTTIEATSVGYMPTISSLTTIPIKVNGQPVSKPYQTKLNCLVVEVLVIRPRGGAIVFHGVYDSGPSDINGAWSQLYQDVIGEQIDMTPGYFFILSTFNLGGLTFPPQKVSELLLKAGAGAKLSEWVNNTSWQNASDPQYESIAYILGGWVDAGENHGFEELVHGQSVKATMKLYMCDQKLQDKVCPPIAAK